MNSLINTLTFAMATFAEALQSFEISEKQDVGQHRNILNNLKITIWIFEMSQWQDSVLFEYVTQQKQHIYRDRAVNISVKGKHSEAVILSDLILLQPAWTDLFMPEMNKKHPKYMINTLWS